MTEKAVNKKNRFMEWVDTRYPWTDFMRKHLTEYYAPKNFNFWYFFGSFSLLVFVMQILTGIWLVMEYVPTADGSFASVQHIMREVRYGWLLRFMHTTGASAFFVVVYLHMYRALIYGSYQKPRELVWLIGMVIYFALLIEAFTGYVLPWGQMSYWGAAVITSFASAIPYLGDLLLIWLRGDFNVSGVTLHRFFSLHVIAIPLFLAVLVFVHLVALHQVGSNNPDGIDIKKKKNKEGVPLDGIPFHPYYTVKDLVGVVVFLFVFSIVVFFTPKMGGYFIEHDNFIPANPLQTPLEISPVWYMTPFYAMLRAIPNKLFGLMTMAAGIAVMFVLPWLDRSPVRSIRYKGTLSKIAIVIFVISFVGLGYLGSEPVSTLYTLLARLLTVTYFAFFLLMPFYSKIEKTKPLPERVTE
ncbi:cytochrome b [Aquicella lusitana]|uniref:Cytochrome b n=1 Tax=Aquicella lusitana TaxID=254246 RepID=A0A370GFJ1_9COXI|nr:cytochrome bc complex cytochrome b subunit [Aquicella lusitana]RDI42431.1 ubiquinol-cytochrome c reductase cytochrome b subunit [Aquicella lusitana]VVC74107.1 Cytochrome b/c1 [Aquicella lusitana]